MGDEQYLTDRLSIAEALRTSLELVCNLNADNKKVVIMCRTYKIDHVLVLVLVLVPCVNSG